MPGFHAILVVREEGDIIAQVLAHLLTWCDSLHVYDTGSTDDTWAIVQDAAGRDSRIKAIGSEPVLFTDTLRAWIFERARASFRRGDWFARVDADEFYHLPPPQFVAERVRPGEGRICTCSYDFLLTRSELKAWQEGRETVADRSRPIEERRRYYRFDPYPEQRFFRYRRGMKWLPERYDPAHGGLLARERIPIRHYRARDPLQLQVRCAIREPTAEAVPWAATHWNIADWRRFIFGNEDPAMHRWEPGSELPEHPARQMPFTGRERLLQHLYYRSGLVHVHDRLTRNALRGFRPTPMDPQVQQQITANLQHLRERPYLRDRPPQLEAKLARRAAANAQEAQG